MPGAARQKRSGTQTRKTLASSVSDARSSEYFVYYRKISWIKTMAGKPMGKFGFTTIALEKVPPSADLISNRTRNAHAAR